jgi:hypothetical protein
MTDNLSGSDSPENTKQNIRTIWIIAVIGAVPIIIFTALIAVAGGHSGYAAPLVDAYKVYSAILLSFLGGIQWGIVLVGKENTPSSKTILISLIAPLIGWIAVFVAEPMCFALLTVGFAGQGAWDNFAAHNGYLPLWYSKIRMILTSVVILSLAITMYATA